jgi:hypothetical protein
MALVHLGASGSQADARRGVCGDSGEIPNKTIAYSPKVARPLRNSYW